MEYVKVFANALYHIPEFIHILILKDLSISEQKVPGMEK